VKRRTDLNRATDAARRFIHRGRESSATSLRRSQIRTRRKKRDTELTQHEARLQEAFRVAAKRQGKCQNCGYEGVFVEAHHAIPKNLLRRLLLKKGAPVTLEVLWDPDNALLLCAEPAPNRCHGRHTLAFRRIRRAALRPENWAFARRHGLEWVLITEYPLAPSDHRRRETSR
jgi:hypothetical protein